MPLNFSFVDCAPDRSGERIALVEVRKVFHDRVVWLGDSVAAVFVPFARWPDARLRPVVFGRDEGDHGERWVWLSFRLGFDDFTHEDVR